MPGGTISPVPTYTPESFAHAVLSGLGLKSGPAQVNLFVAWEKAEGGHWKNSAKYNPLNTSMVVKGSKPINSHNVQAYQSWTDGTRATIDTLKLPAYANIRTALDAADKDAFVNAVTASPWGTPREPLNSLVQQASEGGYSAGNILPNLTSPLSGITNTINSALSGVLGFLKAGIATAGVFSLGLTLVVLGIVVIALGNKNVRTAVGEAATATPVGRGAKLAGAAKGGSRALSAETLAARESAKTAAAVDRAKKLAEVRSAIKESKPKKATPKMPSDPSHPLHYLYLRGKANPDLPTSPYRR